MATKVSTNQYYDGCSRIQKQIETILDYESDNEDREFDNENDFYDRYEPYEEEHFGDDDYEAFDPEKEEAEHKSYILTIGKRFIVKPLIGINSPTKSAETSPKKSPTWWDKRAIIDESNRLINGVLNYAVLLPPPKPKPMIKDEVKPKKSKKNKKSKAENKPSTKPTEKPSKAPKQALKLDKSQGDEKPSEKPTRFCLSVLKKSKCFHGTKCRYAHAYSDLRECNFGDRCNKISLVKTNPDGTKELTNKNGVTCNFKHTKESMTSYLKRVPQQHTSPKNK